MYQPRCYRKNMRAKDLEAYTVCVEETDLRVFTQGKLKDIAIKSVVKYRQQIKDYIKKRPDFYTSLKPIKVDKKATNIVQQMIYASTIAKVGPMAAVAGAISEFVAKDLLMYSDEVIIENGGDIFIKTTKPRTMLVYAHNDKFNNLLIKIEPSAEGDGICTSAIHGHSLSFGKADAVVVKSKNTLLADAVATSAGNLVKSNKDVKKAMNYISSIEGVSGCLIIIDSKLGAWGDIKFTEE